VMVRKPTRNERTGQELLTLLGRVRFRRFARRHLR
jgi:hypothetical protein